MKKKQKKGNKQERNNSTQQEKKKEKEKNKGNKTTTTSQEALRQKMEYKMQRKVRQSAYQVKYILAMDRPQDILHADFAPEDEQSIRHRLKIMTLNIRS